MTPFVRTLLAAAVIGTCCPVGLLLISPVSAQDVAAIERTTVFLVANMTCELCPLTVKAAMERVPGVHSVVIDFDAKTATVVFDPAVTEEDAIAAASTSVGYPARVLGS